MATLKLKRQAVARGAESKRTVAVAAEPVKPRRGRPPLPENNDTRERILSAAQQLFAQRSFTQVNMREITEAAGVSLAAVNYHFGTKDGLVTALFNRAAPQLIAERAGLLEAATLQGGSRKAQVRALVYALIAPVIRWSLRAETQTYYVPFLERVSLDGPPEVRQLIDSETNYLQPFVDALADLLPELARSEIYWRLNFILGIEHSLHTEMKRWQALSGNACDFSDPEAVIERVVEFVLPGLLAPAPR